MISKDEYKFISDRLGDAQFNGENIAYRIDDALTILQNNELSSENLLKQIVTSTFSDTYSVLFENHVNITSAIFNLVDELQSHVISNYGSLDSFLSDKNIKVTADFAVLSELVGYEIDPIYVE